MRLPPAAEFNTWGPSTCSSRSAQLIVPMLMLVVDEPGMSHGSSSGSWLILTVGLMGLGVSGHMSTSSSPILQSSSSNEMRLNT